MELPPEFKPFALLADQNVSSFSPQVKPSTESRSYNKCDYVTANDRKIKIILVGTTGVGKSTLGNFITRNGSFKVSDDGEPGTTEPQSETFFVNERIGRLFEVIDTPGINDKNDLENLKKLKIIFNYAVHCVVLCLSWDTRINDVNGISTIEFYRDLLLPVVRAGNVVLVITKFPPKMYKKMKNDDSIVTKRKKLEHMVESTLGHKIGLVEVTNAGDINHNEEIYSETKNARFRILMMASKFKPQSLGCYIPLPPYLRTSQTMIKNFMIQFMEKQKCRYVDDQNKLVQQLDKSKEELNQESKNLKDLETTLKEKSKPQKTTLYYAKGDDIFNFASLEDQFISIPGAAYNQKLDSIVWNCSKPTIKKTKMEGGNSIVYFDVVPDFITWTKSSPEEVSDEPQRWFAIVWVTYNLAEEQAFQYLEKEIIEKKEIVSNLENAIKQLKPQIGKVGKEKANELEESRRKLSLLQKTSFTLQEIDDVVKILKDLMLG